MRISFCVLISTLLCSYGTYGDGSQEPLSDATKEQVPSQSGAEDKGQCDSESHDSKKDLVPISRLLDALKLLKESDDKLRKKEELVKDIRSRWKYLKESNRDLKEENKKLREENSEMVGHKEATDIFKTKLEEAEGKLAMETTRGDSLEDENNVLWRVINEIREQFGAEVGVDIRHEASKLKARATKLEKQLEEAQKNTTTCETNREKTERDMKKLDTKHNNCEGIIKEFNADMSKMAKKHRDCKVELKTCTTNLNQANRRVSSQVCGDADRVYEGIKTLQDKMNKSPDSKPDAFLHELMRQYGKCVFELGTKDVLQEVPVDESTQVREMQEFCGQMKSSFDSCVNDVLEKDKEISKHKDRVKKCQAKLKPTSEDKAPEGKEDAPIPTLYKHDDQLVPTLYKVDEETLKKHKANPWRPENVPDITDMPESEVRDAFTILKQDYLLMWETADTMSESFNHCSVHRHDNALMKYFVGKDLYHARVELAEARKELNKIKSECSGTCAVSQDDFDIIKRERNLCLDDIKQVRRKAALDSRDLKSLREEFGKVEKELTNNKFNAEACKAEIDHLEFVRKGSQMVIEDMEKEETDAKDKVKNREKEIRGAVKEAEQYRLYFASSMVFVTIMISAQLYGYLTSYLAMKEEEKLEAKKVEKIEKKARKLKNK